MPENNSKSEKKKKIEIKERGKPSDFSAEERAITYRKRIKVGSGGVDIAAKKNVGEKGGYGSIAGSFTTQKGGNISGSLDTEKNISAEYVSPKGRAVSISKETEGPISGSYTSLKGATISLSKPKEGPLEAAYTSPSGKTVSGYYKKGGGYGGSISGGKISAKYDYNPEEESKTIGATYRNRGKLISAKYDIASKRGEISATIPIRKRKSKTEY